MRVAIVHDWLVTYAGAERVLEQMLNVYPDADLFSVVDFIPSGSRGFIHNKPVITTFIQKLPLAKSKYRSYLPLMPIAIEQLDLSAYDLVLSSSHAVAKGVLTGPDQIHVCYIYSPIRYAWDLHHQYLNEAGLTSGFKSVIARLVLHYMRLWDMRTVHGVDKFISCSKFIGSRVRKVYGRTSDVVYPPVDLDQFSMVDVKEDFYLTASRMVPYKKIPLIVRAFNSMPDKRLIVIGDGPEFEKVKALALKNVVVLGFQPTEVLIDHMQRAKAFVFAAEEDFGIAPVEAQACGTPVIAFGKGGALETVADGQGDSVRTGVFFKVQDEGSIVDAVTRFERLDKIDPYACRANAERFAASEFCFGLKRCVDETIALMNE